ncbi:phage portal protein [Xylanimonas ulmi]|uniref:A118 family predicted phage portal protein n=1 Tax=Xylanimonas ulmi TaxID=228973 RepID=A0A4Q7M1G4_9MICO|nr:phage portal protein [Xylanibacterium ulmi]RZS61676.1 A118 family predicted phage portal protein [Xylanibacterium ulmi]
MPLPVRDQAWPPADLQPVQAKLREWDAWWTGDPSALERAYRGTASPTPADRPAQRRGGVVGALARFWWGRPINANGQRRDDTHVPLASDIARASADMLFSQPLTLTVDDKGAQARLDTLLADQAYATLTGAAEQAAALGGVYVKVAFDREVADTAFLVSEPADRAIPELAFGRLRAVTFWRVVRSEGQQVWRHLERHEVDAGGYGVTQHGLYQGTPDRLGRPVPLADVDALAPLAGSVNEDGYVTEGATPGLDVVYVPNDAAAAARAWRHIPTADGWGASDFDGVEGFLDNLDEAYASWMRDIRLGKARLLLAQYMLDSNGPGLGAAFDLDRDVYTPLKMAAVEDGDAPITQVQFAIRFAEHKATVDHWTDQIITSSGYSPATFGRDSRGSAMTATEVDAREARSATTRARKIRTWSPALRQIIAKLLEVDAVVFNRGATPADGLRVLFPDAVQQTPEDRAQAAQLLKAAGAASTDTLVRMVNPDWDDVTVGDEVARILAENAALPDPYSFGG